MHPLSWAQVQDGRTYGVDYTHFASKPTAGVVDASIEVNKGLKLAAGCGQLAHALQEAQHVCDSLPCRSWSVL